VSKYDWHRVAGEFRDLYQEAVKARVVASGRAADKA
jgi:hypothetical protein